MPLNAAQSTDSSSQLSIANLGVEHFRIFQALSSLAATCRNNGRFPKHFTKPQADAQERQRQGSSTGQQPGQRSDHGRSIDRYRRVP